MLGVTCRVVSMSAFICNRLQPSKLCIARLKRSVFRMCTTMAAPSQDNRAVQQLIVQLNFQLQVLEEDGAGSDAGVCCAVRVGFVRVNSRMVCSEAARANVATFLVLMFAFAGYYTRETLSALSTEVMRDFELSHAQYAFISTLVAIPTIFLAFLVRCARRR